MVEANIQPPLDDDDISAEQLAEWAKKMPARSQEEMDADLEEWLNHPLNCKELTPEMLERPEFQALQQMAFEGTPHEVATNFKTHAYDHLGKLLLKQSKNEEKDFQEALYCFDTAFDQQGHDDQKLTFDLYVGRAKLNLLRAQFGKSKDDCEAALKIDDSDEQVWFILARTRMFVEKYEDCLQVTIKALEKFPLSGKLHDLKEKAATAWGKEVDKIRKVELIHNADQDKMMEVYRAIRAKGIKLGKKILDLPEIRDQYVTLDKKGKLHFPVLILYDEYHVTDFIEDIVEDDRLAEHLRPIFADQAPWDEDGAYRMDTIEIYFEADCTKCLDKKETPKDKSNKKYVKVGVNQTLLSVLQHPNFIVPQFPVLKIISKEHDDFRDAFLDQI